MQSINDFLGRSLITPRPAAEHLEAVMAWLCRAQDVGDDDGVARMYHLKQGWGASYPETTGYIIPTFIEYARYTAREEYLRRARRMADWEIDVQMPSGAVQGGTINDPSSPAVFNTGQVIFGWVAIFRESNDERYLNALIRAGNWLCEVQDDDGAWRRHLSAFCQPQPTPDSYVYNARTAWALCLAAQASNSPRYREAGRKNVAYVVSRTFNNGWSQDNCLNDTRKPLLHTIAYTFQGLLEAGLLLGEEEPIRRVRIGNAHLAESFEQTGQLYGRYDASWKPVVRWRCLTGEAQTAIVWYRLAQVTGESVWRERAIALTNQVKATQALDGNPDVVGGIKGSHPIYGWYGKDQYLNWAAKFFADALMLEAGYGRASTSG
ncbi:hypothetical protein [Alkalilimnicola ehrlichii]|uniref:Squalene cyclase C-terminal domain-containing protein n=2 Tax=Alkalilimnicola ehrlichii TaxID=351052 RepID=A0A3E0WIR5_9GAMM|nr:hypothetical protein [Alkalilimnicola ehrlichii]RFA32113.1 hypothetical protein CAL65_20475 [Alkalilimnicola ehrlichii]